MEIAGRTANIISVPDIVLTTLNARYAHASFGLRYLRANLGALCDCSVIREFDINQRPTDILERILGDSPRVVGIGVYIWNATQSLQLASELKRVAPNITLVIGGPEVSHETDQQEICRIADYVITGEADLAFANLCEQLLAGRRPLMRIIPAELPEFTQLSLPYDLYDADDIAHRVIYVEASRGCPFKCEFCLSSLDVPVRSPELASFLEAMQSLLDRGVRQFKFVDRTFNLNLKTSATILQFFHDRYFDGLFLHFEMIPDRLPAALRGLIAQFPPGSLQFEVGVQSFNPDVCALISRRQNIAALEDNLRWLKSDTGVHVHADLIVGLPGEDLASFATGFDRLVALEPAEIQIGMLKRLRGTPIVRHDQSHGMVYSPHPPYEILQTRLIDFAQMQQMRRFARFWDLIANSGNFPATSKLILRGESPFTGFLAASRWLYEKLNRTHAIALPLLAEMIFRYLTEIAGVSPEEAARTIWQDFSRGGRREKPEFLASYIADVSEAPCAQRVAIPRRQARHLA